MRTLPQRGDKLPEFALPPVSARQIASYAEASLDFNPVHTDPQLALSVGLQGVPVQGMLIMGQFEAAIRQWRPDVIIKHLDARFIRPLLADRSFSISGRVAQCGDEGVMVRLTAADDNRRLVCVGGARVSFPPD